ncbi:MAG: nucleotide-binding protein [Candidatus Bathyarchaeota archaeon]|nr:nucleotide-binding protein [Candidatus Bathyarchaeota archaeon]
MTSRNYTREIIQLEREIKDALNPSKLETINEVYEKGLSLITKVFGRNDEYYSDWKKIDIPRLVDCENFSKLTVGKLHAQQKMLSLCRLMVNELKSECIAISKTEKKIVFIAHGREKTPALELKDYLKDTLHLNAVIFDDAKKGKTSPTIIELLEKQMKNTAYAFITATPDDLGCLCKDIAEFKESRIGKRNMGVDKTTEMLAKLKTRARQNVVFEFGLFMGALGRERVCCLLNVNVKDKPTDIDGIIYEPFKESVRETFPQIYEKLKDPKIGLVKT